MTYQTIAQTADHLVRDRYDIGYEILFDGEHHTFVIAAPRNSDGGGEPSQPTAICIGDADDFEDAEGLYEAALSYTDEVDKLALSEEEW